MSQRLKKYAPLLRMLNRASPTVRKRLMKNACNNEFVKCVCECAKNIIKGNVPLTSAQKGQLSRRKRLLRKLVLKKTSLKGKQKIIQSGGFLGAILGPIISVLGSLFGGGQ